MILLSPLNELLFVFSLTIYFFYLLLCLFLKDREKWVDPQPFTKLAWHKVQIKMWLHLFLENSDLLLLYSGKGFYSPVLWFSPTDAGMAKCLPLNPVGRRGSGRGLLWAKEQMFPYSGTGIHNAKGSTQTCTSKFTGTSLHGPRPWDQILEGGCMEFWENKH